MILRRSILNTLALAALLAAGGDDRKTSHRDRLATKLAAGLDLPVGELFAGLRAVARERLDSLVEDGWLTAAERDARLTCFDDPARAAAPACVLRSPGWDGRDRLVTRARRRGARVVADLPAALQAIAGASGSRASAACMSASENSGSSRRPAR